MTNNLTNQLFKIFDLTSWFVTRAKKRVKYIWVPEIMMDVLVHKEHTTLIMFSVVGEQLIPHTQFYPKGEPHRTDAPHFCTGRDCLWDSEEEDWEWTVQLICSSLLYGTRLPLGQQGAKPLCWSSLSQRQFCSILKWGATALWMWTTAHSD